MNAKDIRTTAAERLGAEESARHQAAEEIADTGIPAGEQIGPAATKKPSKLLLVLAAMGPGIVTAMAGNDAGGISTYSTAGANFGFGTLWVIPIMCVLLAVVETTAGRMGAVTGKGFAALIRERFGIRIAAFAMLALLIGNVATTFSNSPASPRAWRCSACRSTSRYPWRPWACGCSWWAAPTSACSGCS